MRNVVYMAVLLIVANEIYQKPDMGLGVFMLVFTLSRQLQDITSKLLIGAAQFESDINYMKIFFDLKKLERENIDDTAELIENGDIKFENVNFSYPNSEKLVIKDLNLTIKSGEKIAIVGKNGSGKSTFVNLICGMYEPDSGVVKINDINIHNNLTAVRRSISVVFQDFGHYEATIRENITYMINVGMQVLKNYFN
ncbi:ATP-binding cassette domain-containing protein [Clostridium sp. MSJ-4]|uniref:ATP-binding cassette domain-containing protein n=1 Tax=Clostridium simiarum TaxID=2841506 RepID=A0ABS6EX55_9CLOT|nr:ABC transporter ATP-binding protein [Clostridium simiarum]MBU5590583.1 ATP-binding cassette domain-containing protein [Clostridium simiarum]